jgi:hypothetical protein
MITVDTLRWHWAAVARAGRQRPWWKVLVGRGETSHLQRLGGLNEAGELCLWNRCLPLVHKVHDALYFPTTNVLEDDDGVLAGVVSEDFLKIRTAKESSTSMSPLLVFPFAIGLQAKNIFIYLHADKTTLCALTEVSSHTRVQSTRDSFWRSASKALRT